MENMMFQNFTPPSAPIVGQARLRALRKIMAEAGVDGLLVPHADEQRNEYLPENTQRLAWLTGFTGSAGQALILANKAILFVDGRYTLQAAQQVDEAHWTVESLIDCPPSKWLKLQNEDLNIAYDPWLHTAQEIHTLEAVCKPIALQENAIDAIWDNQPSAPMGQVSIHPLEFAGQTTAQKLDIMQTALQEAGADLCVICDASSVSWLFNIRGKDVEHTPLVLAHVILRLNQKPVLLIHPEKLNEATRSYLAACAELQNPENLVSTIKALSHQKTALLDLNASPYALTQLVESVDGKVIYGPDPVALPRARKNSAEIAGSREAHMRDGAAVSTFLSWFEEQAPGSVTEIEIAQKLETIRRDMAGNRPLMDISFDTISGSGPNGAIVHYRVTQETNRTAQNGELFLIDSGAQYEDGTTDITRTLAVGDTSPEARRCYTLVLKGHIALSTARFPAGTRGVDIDILARNALWRAGMDYAHGTGHGVGAYLAVHEGPQNISKRGMSVLEPGMILSNEPGYYRNGKFGIRIENLILVKEAEPIKGGDIPMLGFETLTLAPYDRRLIEANMLDDWERDWVNTYHARVLAELRDRVSGETKEWLIQACAPL